MGYHYILFYLDLTLKNVSQILEKQYINNIWKGEVPSKKKRGGGS